MTVDQAERAILEAIGPRPIKVTPDNRKHVRRWLAARGLPRLFVDGLSKFELQAAYNGTLSNDDGFKALQAKLAKARDDEPDFETDDTDDTPAPVNSESAQAVVQSSEEGASLLEAAIRVIAATAVPKANLDEARVLELVRKEIASLTLPRPLHIQINDQPAVKVSAQHPCFERVLKLVVRGANVMLVGPAGCGKTHLCEQLAKALQRDYAYISGTAGVSESAITGWLLPADGGRFQYTPSDFVKLYERGNAIILLDEMDAFDPNMIMISNTATANGHMSIPHRHAQPIVTRGPNVGIVASCNTYGTGANPVYSSRNPLDGATLDRWIVVTMDYDTTYETAIAKAGGLATSELDAIWKLRDKVRESGLRRVVSTRAIQKAIDMKDIGDDWNTIMATLTEGWTKDEKGKAGLH